jgi:hypothetical protein
MYPEGERIKFDEEDHKLLTLPESIPICEADVVIRTATEEFDRAVARANHCAGSGSSSLIGVRERHRAEGLHTFIQELESYWFVEPTTT